MDMFNPPHPGEIIREDCLKPLDLSVTAAAKWLGVSRVTLSELLNGHNGVTAEMASKYPPAKPGALLSEPLKAAGRGRYATPVKVASSRNNSRD